MKITTKITTYDQLKKLHGKRVACEISGREIRSAVISLDKDGSVFICQNKIGLMRSIDMFGYLYSFWLCDSCDENIDWNEGVKNLRTVEKTLENLEVGDVLVNKIGVERTVLGVCGRVVFLTGLNEPEIDGCLAWTIDEMKKEGLKLKQPEESYDTIVELTLQEIADLKGIPVEHLRIKEEK